MAIRDIRQATQRFGQRFPRLVLHDDDTTPRWPLLHIQPTAVPSITPVAGDVWVDSSTGELNVHNGTAWSQGGTNALYISPLAYGAVGDASTDDTTAIQTMLDAVRTRIVSVASPRRVIIDGGHKVYRITNTLTFNGFKHARFQNLTFRVDGTLSDVLLFKGMQFCDLENVLIVGHDSGSFGDTSDYALRFERDATYGVVTMVTLRNVNVIDFKCKTAFAFGPNSTSNQVDNVRLYGCIAYGNNDETAVDTTWWQNGFLFGSGTAGNILNYDCFGCIANKFRWGCTNDSTNVYWRGGAIEGAESAFRQGGGRSMLVQGMRVESCQRVYDSMASAGTTPVVVLDTVTFDANSLASDTYWIRFQTGGTLHLRDIGINNVTTTPVVRLSNAATEKMFVWDGCRAPFHPKDGYSAAGTTHGHFSCWSQVDGSGTTTDYFPFLMLGETPMEWFVGTTAPDASLYRVTSTGRLTATGYLASNNGFYGDALGAGSNTFIRALVGSEANPRFTVLASGRHDWGAGGGSAVDTNLYRTAANQLKTDDTLIAADGIGTKTKAGTPSDADFATTPPDGTIVLDTTNARIYLRVGGVWKYAALT